MLLCLCYGVSEKIVLKELSEGAATVEALQSKLKVGTNCGSCVCQLRELVNQAAYRKQDGTTELETESRKPHS